MLIVLRVDAGEDEVRKAVERVETAGLRAHPIPGTERVVIGVTGNRGQVDPALFQSLPGVLEVIPVSNPYKLVSREFKPHDTLVEVGAATFGGRELPIIAGPCSVESYEQTLRIAQRVKKAGATLLRGGAFKPRTSPYSFQGLGLEGLEILARVRSETGMGVVSEALDIDVLDAVAEHCDMVQIGARNMQNTTLLKRAGRCGKPILLKRGLTATLEELLLAAEYVLDAGNTDVVLCERGVRTFVEHTRNTLDIGVFPAVEAISHLPIIADPSHAAGRRDRVLPLACAAVAAGADGLMIEVHDRPRVALSDGGQALRPKQFEELVQQIEQLAPVFDRLVPSLVAG